MSLQAGDTVRGPGFDHDLKVILLTGNRVYCLPANAQQSAFMPSGAFFSGDEQLQFMIWALRLISSPSGTDFFTTAQGGSNSGTGAIDAGAIVNGEKWIPDVYTITFASPVAWTVKNSGGTQVASGAYADPTAIAFLGVEVTISGAPASGDTFTLNPVLS
jgi:hypothetical protein